MSSKVRCPFQPHIMCYIFTGFCSSYLYPLWVFVYLASGIKSSMNCLNESVGSKKWSVGFYYFILLLSIMHNISDDLHIQPVCSDGVVRINGLWWMPLLVDYVGSLVLFPIRV